MKKKILALALAGVLVVGALTGCGSSKSESSDKKTDDKKITVAASATPHAEILEEAKTLLKELGLIKNVPTLVSCPTCGRIQYDLIPVAKEIEDFLRENCKPGDLLITMGAGDVVNIGEELLK